MTEWYRQVVERQLRWWNGNLSWWNAKHRCRYTVRPVPAEFNHCLGDSWSKDPTNSIKVLKGKRYKRKKNPEKQTTQNTARQ